MIDVIFKVTTAGFVATDVPWVDCRQAESTCAAAAETARHEDRTNATLLTAGVRRLSQHSSRSNDFATAKRNDS